MRKPALAAVLFLAVFSSTLSAATMHVPDDRALTGRAQLVVAGTITAKSARVAGPLVMTDYELLVEEVLKGKADQRSTIVISEYGGYAGGRGIFIPGSATYAEGEQVIVFLRERGDGTWFTASMGAGKFRVDVTLQGDSIVTRDFEEASNELPLSTDAFKSYIADLARGIEAASPRAAASALRTLPRIEPNANASAYVISGGSPAKPLRWAGCESTATCNINVWSNGTQPALDGAGALARARGAWANDPNSGLAFVDRGNTTATTVADDGVNAVLLGSNAPALGFCDGSEGCAVGYFNGVQHTFKGEEFYRIEAFDIVIRPGAFSQTKLDALITHEIGHVLGFRHSDGGTPFSTNAVMNSTVAAGGGAQLRAWDMEAVATVYGNGLPCQTPSINSVSGNSSVTSGNTVLLSVSASGSTPLQYQWYEGTTGQTGTPVGTDAPSFRTPALTATKSYWVKVSNGCGNAPSDTITITVTPCNRPAITIQPVSQRIKPGESATLSVSNGGTTPFTYVWFQGPLGNTSNAVSVQQQFQTPPLTTTTTYWVRVSNSCGEVDSQLATITVAEGCIKPTITTQPVGSSLTTGTNVTGPKLSVVAAGDAPFTYQWYEGAAPDTAKPIASATAADYTVPGPFLAAGPRRFWVRVTNSCGSADSVTATVDVQCGAAAKPIISLPAITGHQQAYTVSWTGTLPLVSGFEVQEARKADFSDAITFPLVTGKTELTIPAHAEITADTRFYYRVRAIAACNGVAGEYSNIGSIVVTRPQAATSVTFSGTVPFGSNGDVTQPLFIPGFSRTGKGAPAADAVDQFTVTADVPWITITPASGTLPPEGVTVQMKMRSAGLPSGAAMGSVTIDRIDGVAGAGKTASGNTRVNVPVSISLVTPVSPIAREAGTEATLIIPSVGHVDGFNSRFQSDVRIANTWTSPLEYLVSYTPTQSNGTEGGKQFRISIEPGETKGLNDIVKDWYGAGLAGEGGLGTLEIKPIIPNGTEPSALSRVTVASSRTYNINETGTFGQYIPAMSLASFISDFAKDAKSRISLQQISQSAQYRTNLGFVEGSGQPAQIMVTLFDIGGRKLKESLVSLQPLEQRQMSLTDPSLFPGTSLNDGRVEVRVLSETGKVNAYASVLDNRTSDPLLVFPVQPERLAANRFVLPGVAELDNGAANFHTDMRIYNAADTDTRVSLQYYPQSGTAPAPINMTLKAGEVKTVDNTLQTLWNISNSGGAVAVVPENEAPVIVTGRTFSRDANSGTYGQFIPAVSAREAVGEGERSIEVVQLEESPSFRTNVGLLEVTGKQVALEIIAYGPESRITAKMTTILEPNEFRQLNRIFSSMGYSSMYNGRVSVKVIGGAGRVAAYGSIIDNRTQDPTYVPAQ